MIHSIASQYIWDNVYNYDKEFRLHIAKHPERSWSVILQQAWSMYLRDRLVKYDGGGNNYSSHKAGQHSQNHPGNGKTKGGKSSSTEANAILAVPVTLITSVPMHLVLNLDILF